MPYWGWRWHCFWAEKQEGLPSGSPRIEVELHKHVLRNPQHLVRFADTIGNVKIQVCADHFAHIVLDLLIPVFLGDIINFCAAQLMLDIRPGVRGLSHAQTPAHPAVVGTRRWPTIHGCPAFRSHSKLWHNTWQHRHAHRG